MPQILKNKYVLGALAVVLALGGAFFAGRYTAPTKIQEVEKVKTVKDTVTVVKEITRPDGTKEKETMRTSRNVIESEKNKTITTERPKNKVNLGTNYDFREKRQDYTLGYERRVMGPVWAGATVDTKGTVGVTIGLEF